MRIDIRLQFYRILELGYLLAASLPGLRRTTALLKRSGLAGGQGSRGAYLASRGAKRTAAAQAMRTTRIKSGSCLRLRPERVTMSGASTSLAQRRIMAASYGSSKT